MNTEDYDYFRCEICQKIKPVGCELVRKVAYSNKGPKSQNDKTMKANLSAYYVLICSGCETEAQPDASDAIAKER
jgi:hypothetical protein